MRGWLYDMSLTRLTSGWYRAVLGRLPPGSRVLDVGIGTAGALLRSSALLDERDLRVVGVDIDADYVRRARRRVDKAGLSDRIRVEHTPLERHAGGPYDAVYFAGSFMLFPDPAAALVAAQALLAPDGKVVFTQTFQDRRSATLERVKPHLKRVTGIDFGRVTYERAFLTALSDGGLEVVEHVRLARHGGRSSRLVVARPFSRT